MKKYGVRLAACALAFMAMAGCTAGSTKENQAFDLSAGVVPINRESGSGTKISFLDFLGLEEKALKQESENIVSDTAVMLSAVESNRYAVGYLSHSGLGPAVKPISVNGIMPDKAPIVSGEYPLTRTIYLVNSKAANDPVGDFLAFAAANSQAVEECGYVAVAAQQSYSSKKPKGEIKISGSSSVYPLAEALAEQYKAANPNAKVEINKTDSSDGIKRVEDGIAHIAMSSRALTSQELGACDQLAVAKDAIAVIVNPDNPVKDITLKQLSQLFTGEIDAWKGLM